MTLRHLKKIIAIGMMCFFMGFAFTGCKKEGPAEKAGKKIDQSVDKAGDKAKELGDKIEDKTDR